MLILGIDPGTATTGYGLVDEDASGAPRLMDYGVIQTAAGVPMPIRLLTIYREATALIRRCPPDAVAVEELFFKQNVSTALTVGQARGVILLAAAEAGLPIYEYKPAEVKQALVGYGARKNSRFRRCCACCWGWTPSRVPTMPQMRSRWRSAICTVRGCGA